MSLLSLPPFLIETPAAEPSAQELADAYALTAFFLLRHVLEPRGLHLPEARASFIAAVAHAARATDPVA